MRDWTIVIGQLIMGILRCSSLVIKGNFTRGKRVGRAVNFADDRNSRCGCFHYISALTRCRVAPAPSVKQRKPFEIERFLSESPAEGDGAVHRGFAARLDAALNDRIPRQAAVLIEGEGKTQNFALVIHQLEGLSKLVELH